LRRAGIFLLFIAVTCTSSAYAQTISDVLNEGFRLHTAGKYDEARDRFDRVLARALETQNALAEAEARRGIGAVLASKTQFVDARQQFNAALELFMSLGERSGAGLVYNSLAYMEWVQSDLRKAADLYYKALAEFEAAGNSAQKANVLYNLTFIETEAAQVFPRLQEALALSEQSGAKLQQGLILHRWADELFLAGRYAESIEKLERAIPLLEEEHAVVGLTQALTSLGRLYRIHGAHERSLELYFRALNLNNETGNPIATIQSLNAVAVGLQHVNRHAESIPYLERALQLAIAAGAKDLISDEQGRLGILLASLGDSARAIPLLETALNNGRRNLGSLLDLAAAYSGANREVEALKLLDEALQSAHASPADDLFSTLTLRAKIRRRQGDAAGATADIGQALQVLETMRTNAAPVDQLKRGFADQHDGFFSFAVTALNDAGRRIDALEVAEHARGRAFLDLLATREIQPKEKDRPKVAALRQLEKGLHESDELWKRWQSSDSELRSMVAAEPVSIPQLTATLKRLQSTLIAYWVNSDKTFIWIVKPDGSVQTASVAVSDRRLQALIAGTTASLKSSQPALSAPSLLARGGDSVQLAQIQSKEWRELYRLLIRPIQQFLPRTPGSLLTIVPHGPLFKLSFAALVDEENHYLIERYRIHYTPSMAALDYTKNKTTDPAANREYVVIADPARTPADPSGKALPPLPGSRKEAVAIAEIDPEHVKTITGIDASEQRVRIALSTGSVLHFATHGILRSDEPFESFIALGKTGASESDDGRLTAREIYQLDLKADLVFLSACRSGLGEISSDGVIGLTRAFFYAGTPSVLATVWDVADEPTSRLVSSFYRAYFRNGDKSAALRDAQLQLIRALRSGQVKMSTPVGAVALPEHPLFWAGFLIFGEP